MSNINGPLAGIKIIDIGTMLAAPLAAGILADQGADVIKVEPPGLGDLQRYVGASCNGIGSLHQTVNRGKRSLALNLKHEDGLAVLKKMVADADVLIHNFRPGVPEKLGVDYGSLSAINPDLVYLSVTGFGHEGPMAHRAAFDNVVQAFSGVAMSQANLETGEPVQYYQIFSDKLTATYASQAITAALLARANGHGGQHVQLAMVDAVANFMWPDVAGIAMFKDEGATLGLQVAKGVPLVKFRNGYGQVAPVSDEHFHNWCEVFGVDSSDPKVATMGERSQQPELMAEISRQISEVAAQSDVDDMIEKLEEADVPCAKAHNLEDLPQHPQMQANGLFVESDHPVAGRIVETQNPVHYSKTPSGCAFGAATLGQHSDEVLADYGYTSEQIEQWRAAGTVA